MAISQGNLVKEIIIVTYYKHVITIVKDIIMTSARKMALGILGNEKTNVSLKYKKCEKSGK